MSRTVPPIPPPLGTSSGSMGNPNVNRVDTMPTTTDPINTTTTTNVSQSVVDENLPQLLDSRGGSHVTNVPNFDKDDFTKSVSSEDKGTTKIRALMAIAKDEPSVRKADARSSQWVDITMKKVHRLLSMTDSDERKNVLDYTHVDLHYVEDQRKNLVNKFNLLKQELSLHSKVIIDQLLSEQIPGNIVKALGGRGKRKEKISSKEVIFTKADESSSMSIPKVTSDSESESPMIPRPFKECKYCGFNDHHSDNYEFYHGCEILSVGILKEIDSDYTHVDLHYVEDQRKNLVNKYNLLKQELSLHRSELFNLKNTMFINYSLQNEVIRVNLENESLKEEISDLKKVIEKWTCSKVTIDQLLSEQIPDNIVKVTSDSESECETQEPLPPLPKLIRAAPVGILKEKSGPKVVFGDDSSGDTEGYGLVNYNGITFTMVVYVNGLKSNLINISQLCDANSKVLFTKTQGTIFNLNDEVVLIAPRKRDIYIIDIGQSIQGIQHQKRRDGKTVHVTFSEDDEAISQSSIEGDAINFNENMSFPNDEFLEPRTDNLESAKIHNNVTNEPISDVRPTPTFLPSTKFILQPPVTQDRWSREKHIKLVNIIGEPLAGIKTKSKVRDSEAASAHKCLYVNFLSKMEPKKLIEALEEEGWIIAI
ncbi:hypothetical protein Tco_1409616 [Tanacetum coccineum]